MGYPFSAALNDRLSVAFAPASISVRHIGATDLRFSTWDNKYQEPTIILISREVSGKLAVVFAYDRAAQNIIIETDLCDEVEEWLLSTYPSEKKMDMAAYFRRRVRRAVKRTISVCKQYILLAHAAIHRRGPRK